MAMNWQKVRQVLDNMYTNKQLAGKIGNENAHEDTDMIIWKQIGTYHGKKQIIRSVCMFLKDGKI